MLYYKQYYIVLVSQRDENVFLKLKFFCRLRSDLVHFLPILCPELTEIKILSLKLRIPPAL